MLMDVLREFPLSATAREGRQETWLPLRARRLAFHGTLLDRRRGHESGGTGVGRPRRGPAHCRHRDPGEAAKARIVRGREDECRRYDAAI